MLVLYYLCQHRFVEAMAAHEELKLLAKVSNKIKDSGSKVVRVEIGAVGYSWV